jgi:2-hydroxy-3-keto-5-methylthiopentenyl-1-phosphate phosphatase
MGSGTSSTGIRLGEVFRTFAGDRAEPRRSGFGHDKSWAILPYRDLPEPPTLFFFGDGVSDLSAAKHADGMCTASKLHEGS